MDYEEYERRFARYQRSLYAGNLMATSLLTTAFCLFAIVWYNPFPKHFNVIYQDWNLVSISTPQFKNGDVQDDAIKEIQKKLTKFSFYDGPINGFYGTDTEKAVINFQRSNGLIVDGIAGCKTQRVLFEITRNDIKCK